MKVTAAELPRLLAGQRRPQAVLLHGEDTALAAQLRETIVTAVAGAAAEAEMRVTRLTGPQCRADPAALDSALRARGFFPGDVAVVVTEATDGLAEMLVGAARDAARPDALLVVVAGLLTAKSALRKAFEAGSAFAAVPCALAAPSREEMLAALAGQGVTAVMPEAAEELARVAADLDGLARAQLVAKLALWQHGAAGPLDLDAVAACAPPPGSADADAVLLAVLARDAVALHRALARALGPGGDGVGVVIALGRFARQVLEARVALDDRGGPAKAALGRVFPPMPWPLQEPVAALLVNWRRADLERLVRVLCDLDASLRSGGREPPSALVARALLRLVLTGAR